MALHTAAAVKRIVNALASTAVIKAFLVGQLVAYPDSSEGRVVTALTLSRKLGTDIPRDGVTAAGYEKRDDLLVHYLSTVM